MCLAPTHEEVVSEFVALWLSGKKQLPIHLYQIGTKFRDEIRPRFGLMRAKEFLMEDSYTFSNSPEQMNEQYAKLRSAYQRIFDRLNLKYVIVTADGGKIGKGKSEEFHVLCSLGEDTICVSGSYGANLEAAQAIPPSYAYSSEFLPLEEVETPGVRTIEDLEAFFKVPKQQIMKTVVVKTCKKGCEQFFAICIRADRQVNLIKVASFLQVDDCELASDEEILKHLHVEKGFIGPLCCPIPYYADETTRPMTNFICANNQKDTHCKYVNWERDIPLPTFGDFLLAEAGDLCPQNQGAPYEIFQGVEVAHIFNLGTSYTESFSVDFQDENGDKQLCWMGTYGIGVGRTLAACLEQLADNKGIVWPLAIAPFSITLLYNGGDTEGEAMATQLYHSLNTAGFEPLLDDRNERLGFKLKDSDLLGIPYKLIIGKFFQKTGLLEIESRAGEKHNLSPDNLLDWCSKNLPCHTRKIPPIREI